VSPVLGDVPRVDLPRFAPAGHPPGRRPLPAPCRGTGTHTLVRPAPGLPRGGRQQRRVLSALAVNGPLTSCEPLFVASAVASHVSSYCSSLRGFWLDGLSDLIRGALAGSPTAISTQSSISRQRGHPASSVRCTTPPRKVGYDGREGGGHRYCR
jgi:hypothetical protein